MKVRRRSKQLELRKLPLSGLDMFLLSCLDGELTVAQLADISSTSLEETERRLLDLIQLGVVECVSDVKKPPTRARKAKTLSPARREASGTSRDRSDEVTMRPPPPSEDDIDKIETLRPLSNLPADLERITPLRPPSLEALFHSEPTGALLKLLTPDRGHPLEEVKIPKKKR